MTEKVKVLYIYGVGRSGSTLLENILAQGGGVAGVGELRFIWARGFGDNQLCGCREHFSDCKFWSAVVSKLFPVNASDIAGLQQLVRHVDRDRYVPLAFFPLKSKAFRERWDQWRGLTASLYKSIAEVANVKTIIDSSKDPSTPFLLSQIDSLDLFVIHLVRDPRAVAHSFTRKRRRLEITDQVVEMPRYSVLHSAREWLLRNLLALPLSSLAKKFVTIRYEDLIASPRETLEKIIRTMELREDILSAVKGNSVVLSKVVHAFSGNPSRFHEGEVDLRADDAWRREMRALNRLTISILTWPYLLKYRYPLFLY